MAAIKNSKEVVCLSEGPQSIDQQLIFQSSISREKPQTLNPVSGKSSDCPFCDRSQLPKILKEDGDILLVPNKYPILKDSEPLVLIETSQCDSELSLYSEDHLLRVFKMALSTWQEMMDSQAYASVLFLKNHGHLSGGSIRHPHMQLIGLKNVDYRRNIYPRHFQGLTIHEEAGITLTLSQWPRIGFYEFNVILKDFHQWPVMCILIQKTVQYLLNHHYKGRTTSYNLFFYQMEGITYCKILPRFVTTPLFMGYGIPQVSDNLHSVVQNFQSLYF